MMEGRIIEMDRQRGRKGGKRDYKNMEGAGVMEMDGEDRSGGLFNSWVWLSSGGFCQARGRTELAEPAGK